MNTWAAPGVKCVALTGPDCAWVNTQSGEHVDPPGPSDRIFTIVSVEVSNGLVHIGLRGDILDRVWDVRGFRPLAYPTQSLEHDVSLFKPAHVPASVVERT